MVTRGDEHRSNSRFQVLNLRTYREGTKLFLEEEAVLEFILLKHKSHLFLVVLFRPIILSIFLDPLHKA